MFPNICRDGGNPDIASLDMSFRDFVDRLRNAQTAIMPEFKEDRVSKQHAADILVFLQTLK